MTGGREIYHSPNTGGIGVKQAVANSWQDEGRDLLRGVGGAGIIGVPLLYTSDLWKFAIVLGAGKTLLLLFVGGALCVGYNAVSGFRKDGGLAAAIKDGVESLAIGVMLSVTMSFLLGVIDFDTSLAGIASIVAVESVPLALGASIANTQFGGDKHKDADEKGDGTDDSGMGNQTLREAGIMAAGAVILGASIAPTVEVVIIAGRLSPLGVAAIALFSLLLSYGMIFIANFSGAKARRESPGALQSPVGETTLSYVIALFVSLLLVRSFHGVALTQSPFTTVALMVTLALPASIGGAVGRLIT